MSRRERPRFSVLLPTHDRAEVVGFAVDSILRQTEPDFELLVVGDGCTDDTSEVVLGYGDPRIRWFDLPKAPGFGYANRNLALREARGDLIAYLAHDDLALPDHLELMARPFEDDEVEWVYSRPLWVSGEGTVVPFAMDLGRPEHLDYFLTTANTLPASCVVHRRGCFEKYGYWPEEIHHSGDWELWKRMLRDAGGGNLAYVPEGSILHFRANWRGTAWAPRPFDAWHAAASSGDSWPAALRVDVPAEGLVQRAFAELLRRDGTAWCRSLREATPRVIESLAWNQAIALPIQIDAARPLVSELLASGAHERALAVAERMVAVAPADAELQYARGRALLGLGRNEPFEDQPTSTRVRRRSTRS